jgi:arsenical pump membrane protein
MAWLTGIVFLIVLVLVMWQPRGLAVVWPATIGAVFFWLVGVVSNTDVLEVWGIVWNATLTVIATIILAVVLEQIGFFEWAALSLAHAAGGNGTKLFVRIVVLGALVATIFNNDGAALMVTPIVLAMLRTLKMDERAVLAYVMASGFIADSMSIPLVISNLVNIVSTDWFGIGFVRYAEVMLLPSVVSFISSLFVLWLVYRHSLPRSYDVSQLKKPSEVIRDHALFRLAWWVLVMFLVAYFVSEGMAIPVSAVAWVAAIVMVIAAKRQKCISLRASFRAGPWGIIIFSIGMYVLVYGVHHMELTVWVAHVVQWLSDQTMFIAIIVMGFFAGISAALMNNLPAAMLNALMIKTNAPLGMWMEAMTYANVIGSDIGPKMTPIGSLATLMWLHVLARQGILIGWGYFCRIGMMLTVPVLFATLCALWLRMLIS